MKYKCNHILYTILLLFLIHSGCNKEHDKTGSVDSSENKTDSITDVAKEQSNLQKTDKDTLLLTKEKDKEDSLRTIITKRRNDSLKAIKEKEVKLTTYYFHKTE